MSVNDELGKSTVDWKALDKDSEEYRSYYLQRHREGFYHKMGIYHKVCPEHQTIRYWRSLPEDKQEAVLDRIMENQPFHVSLNLDDAKVVGEWAFMRVLTKIENMFIRKERAAKAAKKVPGSTSKTHRKAPGDALLRVAIQNRQLLMS